MKTDGIIENKDLMNNVWFGLPKDSHNVFRTDCLANSNWRQLIALNPVDTFVLNDPIDLDKLKDFILINRTNLCAGYLSYDLGLAIQGIHSRYKFHQPLAVFHAYNNWLEMDENQYPVFHGDNDFQDQIKQLILKESPIIAQHKPLRLEPTVSQGHYQRSVQTIHDYIRAGDFYQINYTQQLGGNTNQPPRSLYTELIQANPAGRACYFEFGDISVHSLSPELLLHHHDGMLTTEPIKGTRPRGDKPEADNLLKQELLDSSKEQAELFMITDLLRNDIGKVAEIGSVHISELKEILKLPRVWHTYSRIKAKLSSDLHPIDALFSMFPGGSITGCPKRRAMEVIDELEISSRGIYTGSLGYIHPDGDFSFNIAIRTLVQQGHNLTLGTGGGITIDSNWLAEWDELLVKASSF